VANGSAVSWQHIKLCQTVFMADEKLKDTVGIKPPKLVRTESKSAVCREFGKTEPDILRRYGMRFQPDKFA
jgi:hypothetical protein